MNRGTSFGQFFLAALWLILALYWFFAMKNVFVGCVWLAAAAIILIVGFVKRKQEWAAETKQKEE